MKKNVEELIKRHTKYCNSTVYCSDIELIIDKIFIETEINKTDLKKIIDSEFKILRSLMQNEVEITKELPFNFYKSIRVPRLGSFRPSEKKFNYIQQSLIKKLENV